MEESLHVKYCNKHNPHRNVNVPDSKIGLKLSTKKLLEESKNFELTFE